MTQIKNTILKVGVRPIKMMRRLTFFHIKPKNCTCSFHGGLWSFHGFFQHWRFRPKVVGRFKKIVAYRASSKSICATCGNKGLATRTGNVISHKTLGPAHSTFQFSNTVRIFIGTWHVIQKRLLKFSNVRGMGGIRR